MKDGEQILFIAKYKRGDVWIVRELKFEGDKIYAVSTERTSSGYPQRMLLKREKIEPLIVPVPDGELYIYPDPLFPVE